MGFIGYMYGGLGPSGFGSKSTAEQVSEGISLKGRTVMITGATAGIGLETARVLAKRGATLIIPARTLKEGEVAKAAILKETPGAKIELRVVDLASRASVRKFAKAWKAEKRPVNMLINNAGIVAGIFRLNGDGHESMFGTNHLGHFLLTELLLDGIVDTAKRTGIEGRIVIVSSSTYAMVKGDTFPFDDINDPTKFRSMPSYGLSKLAGILYASDLSRRLKARGANVIANSLHPGVIGTNVSIDFLGPIGMRVFKTLGYPFMKSVQQGAATTVYVATSPSLSGVSGKYFVDCNVRETETELSKDEKAAAQLWEVSKRLTAAR